MYVCMYIFILNICNCVCVCKDVSMQELFQACILCVFMYACLCSCLCDLCAHASSIFVCSSLSTLVLCMHLDVCISNCMHVCRNEVKTAFPQNHDIPIHSFMQHVMQYAMLADEPLLYIESLAPAETKKKGDGG